MIWNNYIFPKRPEFTNQNAWTEINHSSAFPAVTFSTVVFHKVFFHFPILGFIISQKRRPLCFLLPRHTNGHYLDFYDQFRVLSGLWTVWKLVSLDPWPRPAESLCVSFYGNGEIVTTSQWCPAACPLLNRTHLQKAEGPSEMGSDPSSNWLSHIWSYIDIELP